MDGRATLLIAVAAAAASGAGVWLMGYTKAPASKMPISADHARAPAYDRFDSLLERLEQIELRLSALEDDLGSESSRLPAIDTVETPAPEMRAKEEQEFIQRHREEFRALIDESRMDLAWKESQRALGGLTHDLDAEFGLPSGAIKDFLMREYRPIFEAQWRWRDSPEFSYANEPTDLNYARRSFKFVLDAQFPARLAERLFFAFSWERFDALNTSRVSDEQIQQSVARFQ